MIFNTSCIGVGWHALYGQRCITVRDKDHYKTITSLSYVSPGLMGLFWAYCFLSDFALYIWVDSSV